MSEATIFATALDLVDPVERTAYLAKVCAGDDRLRRRVEALLRVHFEPDDILDAPSPGMPTADFPGISERPGTMIGPYKLMEKIGEGGFGLVFVAEQTEPVKRKVAVKVIKPGMDSKQVIARFEAERQALAMMDHPNIARVLDAGTTETGRPYFVMELVRGIPITDYCDQNHLTPAERLELFMSVCHAIQHAHQKGIIHRDIKPSNVLVTSHDGKPVAKVIDFGVAKAIHQHLTERTIYTQFAQMIGTPLYMSPEQAEMSGLDIDTRSDIYSLGVLLYELLTGSTPLERKRLAQAAYDEIRRAIRDEDPPRPSDRLSTSETLPSLAANRKTEPARLSRMLKGELDWIVMKALEKDRTRRYETANGLARDIQRYLSDEVVEARPASAGYRLRKLFVRNKGKVLAASLILLVLLAGIAVSTWQAIRATRAEHLALTAAEEERKAKVREAERAEGERLAKLDAQAKEQLAVAAADKERIATELTAARLKQIETINDSVFDIFAEFDIRKVKEGKDPVEYVLAQKLIAAGKKLDEKAIQDPLVLANLRDRLGQTLLSLGEVPAAIELLTVAVETRKAKLGPDHPSTLTSMNNLALGYQAAGKLDRALPLYEETLKLKKAKLGPDHPDTLTSMNNLAAGYQAAWKLDRALPLFEETLKLTKTKLGPDHPDTLTSMNNLANGYVSAGRLAEALPLLEETLKLCKAKLGPDHPDTLTSMNNLADGYRFAGRLAEALPLFEETLKLTKTKLGPDHPDTLRSMNNLANGYVSAGRLAEALPLYEETLKLKKAKLGPDHLDTLTSMNNLAAGYRSAGRLAEALPLHEETLKLRKAKLGPDHPDTLQSMHNLAFGYLSAGKLAEALPLHEETLKLTKAKLGPDHPNTLMSMNSLAFGYRSAGRLAEALPLYEEAAIGLEKRKFRHQSAKTVIPNTISAYTAAKQFDRADDWRRKWLAFLKSDGQAETPAYAGELAAWGLNLLERKNFTDAEPILRECLALREKAQPDAWNTFNTQSLLGGALLGQKKYADAEPLLLKGYEGLMAREKTIPPQGSTRLPEALDRLIQLYTETNKPEEVKKWQAEKEKLPKAQQIKK